MNNLKRQIILWVMALVCIIPVAAQFDRDTVTLTDFINPRFNIIGVRPAGWEETAPDAGVYLRQRDPLDRTALIIQAIPGAQADVIAGIVAQLGSDEDQAEVLGTLETESFTWSLYQLEREQVGQEFAIDIGLAQDGDQVYIVMLQTNKLFYDQLRVEVFEPILSALAPVVAYEDETYGYSLPIPDSWQLQDEDEYVFVHTESEDVAVYAGVVENDDAEEAIVMLARLIFPDVDLSYEESAVQVQPSVSGMNTSITFLDGTSGTGEVLQGIARVVDDIAYVTIIRADSESLLLWSSDLEIIESGFVIQKPIIEPEAEE